MGFTSHIKLLLTGVFIAYQTAAGEISVVSGGRSDYQIVVPDKGPVNYVNSFMESAAKKTQDCVSQSTGVTLPITVESNAAPDKPGIYIGATKKSGLDTASLKPLEYIIKTSGQDIILTGRDEASAKAGGGYYQHELGTIKAVSKFLELYAGARFVMPGPNGLSVEKQAALKVPANLSIDSAPPFRYCIGRLSGDIWYDNANNFFPSICYGSYGGHSHNVAVPQSKYFAEHPEYFALVKGKHYTHPERPQYCLSNPEVQELIYRELLRKLDEGYEYAQLAQSDGFIPCECENCGKLYGVEDWGEKLWIMHRNMAERLLKDRPGKKVMILSYGPASKPPRTFKEFPANTAVELCKYSPELLAEWRDIKVPSGFTVYVYNWGDYQLEGFTPRRTPEFCKEQIKLFRDNNIRGIYRCGFGELYGLEGPVYYIYGKLLENPDTGTDALIEEFLRGAYPSAYNDMREFFALLHERLRVQLPKQDKTDWNNSRLLDGKLPDMHANVQLLKLRYPSAVTADLEKYLAAAEKIVSDEKEKARLKLVRAEFEYLKKTALIAELFDSYRKAPDRELFERLLSGIEDRNRLIDALPLRKDGLIDSCGGFSLFGAATPSMLHEGGRLSGPLTTPYNWDTALMRKYDFHPGSSEMKIRKTDSAPDMDSPVWRNIQPQWLAQLYMDKSVEIPETTVRAVRAGDTVWALVRGKPSLSAGSKNTRDGIYVFLGPGPSMSGLLMLASNRPSKTASIYKWAPTDNPEAPNEFKMAQEIKTPVSTAWRKNEATGEIECLFKIPLSLFGAAPQTGDVWSGNFFRRIQDDKKMADYIWEPNMNWKTWRNRYDVMGKIIFE